VDGAWTSDGARVRRAMMLVRANYGRYREEGGPRNFGSVFPRWRVSTSYRKKIVGTSDVF
jgi:hypothetical protein